MATEVLMPQMGYDMTEGTVVKWVKQEGDAVSKGEVIAEIETDKATVEMEAEAGGVLRRIAVGEGATVPVGQVIGVIGAADEELPEADAAAPAPPAQAVEEAAPIPQTEAVSAPADGGASGALRASPVARRLADERGVDLKQVTGTGPGGRITKEDVLNFVPPSEAPAAAPEAAPVPQAAPAAATAAGQSMRVGPPPRLPDAQGRIPLSKMALAIARRTAATKGPVPHYYVNAAVDMTRAMEFRREINEALSDVRVSVNDLVIKAAALALRKHPVFNATFQDDHLEVSPHVNVGAAVALDEGLVVPAILECERKPLTQIAKEAKDLGRRAREGKLRQDEYTAGTFSISNLGMFEVDSFTAIIVSPQAAVLAVGAVQSTPVVRNNEVVVRQMMQASLSADHRISNGADAAQFLVEIKRGLEAPFSLIADDLRG
ncbi:MAG: 2-oxo acid dehydrogenase subunit E2 [Dehalococcoidia bacterium]|nr:2-oxo acid dehydrogenase subunit E2 [Dehalococcoidia bacterium]